MTAGEGSARAVPFYCPYCGEEDLAPYGDAGGFYCASCNRRWRLNYLGLGRD